MRNDVTANQPRARNRELIPRTAGCVNRGAIQSPKKYRTTLRETAAETVVALNATTMPNHGPNNTPELNVKIVRGIGNCVITT